MAGTLKFDSAMLVSLGKNLRAVATEFDTAQDSADLIAGAVGHADLARKVKDFASQWDDKRAKMLESIAGLSEAATAGGEQFAQLDEDLAAALLGQQ